MNKNKKETQSKLIFNDFNENMKEIEDNDNFSLETTGYFNMGINTGRHKIVEELVTAYERISSHILNLEEAPAQGGRRTRRSRRRNTKSRKSKRRRTNRRR